MRTTLELPDKLMQEAMRVSHQRTKTAVIISALQELVRKNRLRGLREFKGRVAFDIDLDCLRKRT